ncbi:MAG: septal ring lytic transglycosylase RlpA family protein [Gammaproteobacteria bacterium]|nr:septal ring lytic transglycosylase RlpA family protein [Gammaproteobacteria bacterium]
MKNFRNDNIFRLLILMLSVMLASCAVRDGAPENYSRDWRLIDDAIPQDEPFSRYGNPDSYEVFGQQYQVLASNAGFSENGLASWYGTKFHGQRTSSGEPYDMYAMTAAHKSLRIPTYVEVTNLSNNRKAIVKVNDRGPFHEGRVIDLSYAAATKLGVSETGTAPVTIRVIESVKAEDVTLAEALVKAGEADTVIDQVISKSIVEPPIEAFSGDQYYVQVASFSNEENALKMLNDLRNKEFKSVRIHVEGERDKLLYRVRIGPVPTALVAESLVSKLKKINHNNVRIVALITN